LPKSKDLRDEITKLTGKVTFPPLKDLLNIHKNYKDLQEKKELLKKVESMEESNPMMGRRGSRLGIVVPDLYKMQVKSIVKAALDTNTRPEIMLPMISDAKELEFLVKSLKNTVKEVLTEKFGNNNEEMEKHLKEFKFGTMIELPRAALMAGDLAKYADFFSFGTNDLTQMTYGFSRDDAQKGFLMKYLETGIFEKNPFETIDVNGVGKLIKDAITEGKKTKPELKTGVCGEQGGDPKSIEFFNNSGVDYISCSPTRIPKARLIAGKKGSKNISFAGNVNPNTSQSFNIMKKTLDTDFTKSLDEISKLGQLPVSKIKSNLKSEYGDETANEVKISGMNAGFKDLILMIPGMNPDGTVPDLFPVINPAINHSLMGGEHWQVQNYLLDKLVPEIKREYPDFSFEQLRKDLKMPPINENKALPRGASLPTNNRGLNSIKRSIDSRDKNGNANYACIHGFVVYDGNNNNYVILDNKNGIKEFVKTNQKLFDNLTQRFNLIGVIVGGEPVIENLEAKEKKEKNDISNQFRGELYMTGADITDFPNCKSKKEISSTKLIELLTNSIGNKKYIESL